MEPKFEQKPSGEFDANRHHIFKSEDVVFALAAVHENNEQGGVSDSEYIQWIHDVLTSNEGFGLHSLQLDAQVLENIVRDGHDDAYKKHSAKLLEIAQDMRQTYETNAHEIASELNAFLLKNPGLFLWSPEANDTVDEIVVEKKQNGDLRPALKTAELYIDANRIGEKYRTAVFSLGD